MKTIICVWHTAGKGKTESLRQLALLLSGPTIAHTPVFGNIPLKGDFRFVVEINGKVIAIESQGDPNTNLRKRLLDIHATYNPDIIFCTSRTRGVTVHDVWHMVTAHAYDIVSTSTYDHRSKPTQASLNRLKARHLYELLIDMGLI